MDALDVIVPQSLDDLVGYRVQRSVGPGVRWHPVWDVPLMPRKLPKASAEPPPQNIMPHPPRDALPPGVADE